MHIGLVLGSAVMDLSKLVFYHCDLAPVNLLVDPSTKSIGIIDWELVGYVPKTWVGTKVGRSGGFVLESVGPDWM